MTAGPAPDLPATGINGKDSDSYKDQLEDNFYYNPFVLLLTLIGLIFPQVLPYRAFFPFHNYRQVHVFQNALVEGWNNGAIKKGILPAIPDCPILWQDVSHYWKFGAFLGIIAYELAAYLRVVVFLALTTVVMHGQGASIYEIAAEFMKALFPLGVL